MPLAIILFCLGCGGGSCPTTDIDKFLIFTGTMFGPELREHPDGSATAFTILPREKTTNGIASSQTRNMNFSLFASAHASQPCKYTYKQSIVAIEVRSSADYDGNHPAGTLLNDIIKVQQYTNDLQDPQNLQDIFPVNYIDAYNYYLEFYFAKPANNRNSHRFQLDIYLDDGKIHTVETGAIDLTKFY